MSEAAVICVRGLPCKGALGFCHPIYIATDGEEADEFCQQPPTWAIEFMDRCRMGGRSIRLIIYAARVSERIEEAAPGWFGGGWSRGPGDLVRVHDGWSDGLGGLGDALSNEESWLDGEEA